MQTLRVGAAGSQLGQSASGNGSTGITRRARRAWSGEGPQERPFVRRKPKTATQPGIVAMMTIIKRDGQLPAWAAGLLSLTRNKHLSHVEDAWVNFWGDLRRPSGSRLGVRQPKPKKRSARPSFYLHNQSFRIENGRLVIGRIGAIKLQHEPRYAHRILSATVSLDAGRWHISILRELESSAAQRRSRKHRRHQARRARTGDYERRRGLPHGGRDAGRGTPVEAVAATVFTARS